jgi:LysW-gamma-L-alpha-aminoadipyl-6-phosphate/LysW-L-glutamyl-5-phosphate reductase
LKVSILGGSGYAGGELLRLLINHPDCEITRVTSQRFAGEPLYRVHPNLRGKTNLRFDQDNSTASKDNDLTFTALPHGKSTSLVPEFLDQGTRVVDLAADFRLKNPEKYQEYYHSKHEHPELLDKAVYGLPELHREEIRNAKLVAVPGCMATASILGLVPLVKAAMVDEKNIVIDAKIGSSGAGAGPSLGSHHPEREGGVRPYKVVGHRHTPEIEQELGQLNGGNVKVAFTPHAVGMVRGILATIHSFTHGTVEKKDIWKAYRGEYGNEPFIRMVSDNKGLFGLPNPKNVIGTNLCDIGFETDPHVNRLLVLSAIDNLTKGAAGAAVQCYNIMAGIDERTGLDTIGLHP